MTRFLTAAAISLGLAAPLAAAPINPLALYTFENGIATDDTGNGNTGTVLGGVSLAAGMGFDGGDAIELSAAGGLSGIDTGIDINPSALTNLSMGAWVNVADFASNPGPKILSHDNGSFDRTLGIDNRGNDAGKGFAAFTGSSSVADAPSGLLVTDRWIHLAVVYNGTDSGLFVNGSRVESFSDVTGSSSNNLFIGTNPSFNEDFVGLADDVFVYGRALSDADIFDIFDNGFDTAPAVPLPAGLPMLAFGIAAFAMVRRKA